MPVMKLWQCHNVAKRAEIDVDVRMQKHRLPKVNGGIDGDRRIREAERKDRHNGRTLGEDLIHGMNTMAGKPVQGLDAVMNRVKLPQPWDRVEKAMHTVKDQVRHENRCRYLNPQG